MLRSSAFTIIIRTRPQNFLEDSTLRRPASAPKFLGPGLPVRVLQPLNLVRFISLDLENRVKF